MPQTGDVCAARRSKVVALKRGDANDSVVLVPGIGGSVLSLVWLARSHPGPRTVVALEPVSLSDAPATFASVADLASSHLDAIRAAGGWGRRQLVGHCFGATVAMEMTHQLEAAGEPPAAVALLQPFLRLAGDLDGDERCRAELRQEAAGRLRSALHRPAAELERDPEVRRDLGWLDLDPAILGYGATFARSLLDYAGFALRAYLDHVPRPIATPVHLLAAAGCGDEFTGAERRLRELTGGVTLHELPAPRGAVLRQPHARAVAQTIASLAG